MLNCDVGKADSVTITGPARQADPSRRKDRMDVKVRILEATILIMIIDDLKQV